jgi:hypothetical protein
MINKFEALLYIIIMSKSIHNFDINYTKKSEQYKPYTTSYLITNSNVYDINKTIEKAFINPENQP